MRNMTDAKEDRSISGSVNGGRCEKSCSSYKRIHTPAATRPHRPAR